MKVVKLQTKETESKAGKATRLLVCFGFTDKISCGWSELEEGAKPCPVDEMGNKMGVCPECGGALNLTTKVV